LQQIGRSDELSLCRKIAASTARGALLIIVLAAPNSQHAFSDR